MYVSSTAQARHDSRLWLLSWSIGCTLTFRSPGYLVVIARFSTIVAVHGNNNMQCHHPRATGLGESTLHMPMRNKQKALTNADWPGLPKYAMLDKQLRVAVGSTLLWLNTER